MRIRRSSNISNFEKEKCFHLEPFHYQLPQLSKQFPYNRHDTGFQFTGKEGGKFFFLKLREKNKDSTFQHTAIHIQFAPLILFVSINHLVHFEIVRSVLPNNYAVSFNNMKRITQIVFMFLKVLPQLSCNINNVHTLF